MAAKSRRPAGCERCSTTGPTRKSGHQRRHVRADAVAGVGVYGPGESPGLNEEGRSGELAVDAAAETSTRPTRTARRRQVVPRRRRAGHPVSRGQGRPRSTWRTRRSGPLLAAEGVVYASSGDPALSEAAALSASVRNRRLPVPESTHRGRSTCCGRRRRSAANARTEDTCTPPRRDVYRRACAVCRLDTLQGDAVSPPLHRSLHSWVGFSTTNGARDGAGRARVDAANAPPTHFTARAYVNLIRIPLNSNSRRSSASELARHRELGENRHHRRAALNLEPHTPSVSLRSALTARHAATWSKA